MDRVKRPSPESQSSNLWVVVGVVIPVLVVTVIVVILYWKLCRTDKLDFQPDTVANIQQRQKVSAYSDVRTSIFMEQKQVQTWMLRDKGGPLIRETTNINLHTCEHVSATYHTHITHGKTKTKPINITNLSLLNEKVSFIFKYVNVPIIVNKEYFAFL